MAGPSGVRLIDHNGALQRALSSTPAVAPRWLPDRETLVVLGADGVLRTLDGAGDERTVAALPRELPCPVESYESGIDPSTKLELSMDEEFWISSDGAYACVVLSDAFPNMRLAERSFEVRLADGALTQRPAGQECGARSDETPLAHCSEMPRVSAKTMPELDSPIDGGEAHSVSPDGAWTLVLVGSEMADLFHMQYVLLRNADGAVFSMPTEEGEWGQPIKLPETVNSDTFVAGLPDIIGGETIRWVGPHHVVLDQTLYIAGERVLPLGGDIAP
ncbi:MAG: hypothetical protein KUG77_09110 [Nannocystaceae bacterium]|nr:hypothetical protein [Nannocystaceae bacterium]